MEQNSEVASLTGSIVRDGDNGIPMGVTPYGYRNSTETSTVDRAARKLAVAYRLSMPTARLVCLHSGLGGAA